MKLLSRFKTKVTSFVQDRVEVILQDQKKRSEEQLSYSQIAQLFKEDNFMPFSAWAISPSTIQHLLNDILLNKRESIVEFGSGVSTLFIAKLLKIQKVNASFFSFESDLNWVIELNRQLELYELHNHVQIVYAPLIPLKKDYLYRSQQSWYDIEKIEEALKEHAKIDLILVDGPFGGSTPYARYSAIPFLLSKIHNDFAVFIDDINRKEEREIALEWQKILHCEINFHNRYACLHSATNFDITPWKLD